MAHHIVALNAAFALVQLLIALGLFWPRTVKLALAGSIVWSLMVWWLGEGLGGMFTGPVSPLAGLPGAVVLYAVIAVLLWPRSSIGADAGSQTSSLALRSILGRPAALGVWVLLWLGFAAESLRSANRAPNAIHDLVAGAASGEPAWIGHINQWAAHLLAGRGLGISIALAACFVLIALSVFVPALNRAGVVLAVLISLGIWVTTEDFGGIFTGHGTDPNSGLPLALLALCYWPVAASRRTTSDAATD